MKNASTTLLVVPIANEVVREIMQNKSAKSKRIERRSPQVIHTHIYIYIYLHTHIFKKWFWGRVALWNHSWKACFFWPLISRVVIWLEIILGNCFTSALPICEDHLLYRTQNHLVQICFWACGIIWPLQNYYKITFSESPVKWICNMVLNILHWERSLKFILRWVTLWPPQVSLGKIYRHSFHNLILDPKHSRHFPTTQNNVHQCWLNEFVGCRQMTNHDHHALKIISEWFETI